MFFTNCHSIFLSRLNTYFCGLWRAVLVRFNLFCSTFISQMPDFATVVCQKAAIAAVLVLVALGYWTNRNAPVFQRPFSVWWAFVLFRIVPFGLVYLVLDYDVRSDAWMFYDSARQALQLKTVYRDFDTAYSPLFPYLTALPLLLWNSGKAIVLFLILAEGLAIWLTVRVFKDNVRTAQRAILYLITPAPLVLSVLSGQEDILMWLFGAWAVLVWQKRQDDLWVGIILGLGMVATKALMVLTLIPVFFLVKNQLRYFLGLLLVGLPALVVMYALVGLEFLEPIQQANDPRTPNLWTILRPLFGEIIPLGHKALNWVGLVAVLGLGCALAYRWRRKNRFVEGFTVLFVATYALVMIVQQSSLANYAYLFLLPMLFVPSVQVTKKTNFFLLLLLNFAIVVQPPIWWGLKMPIFKTLNDLAHPWPAAEYLLEVVIVGCLGYFLVVLVKDDDTIKLINDDAIDYWQDTLLNKTTKGK